MPGSRARNAAVAAALALLAAGCGGGEPAAEACDDAAFRAQDEEVYVALATVQNAQSGAGDPTTVATDLRRASAALDGALEVPPCDDELIALAEREQEAADLLDEAADQVEAGEDASDALTQATETLTEIEETLRA